MNLLDLISSALFSSPSLPPLPPEPEPLPEVDEDAKDREERKRRIARNNAGAKSLITNTGGAAGLLDEETDKPKTLGGSATV